MVVCCRRVPLQMLAVGVQKYLEDPEQKHLVAQAFCHEGCQHGTAPVCCT